MTKLLSCALEAYLLTYLLTWMYNVYCNMPNYRYCNCDSALARHRYVREYRSDNNSSLQQLTPKNDS